MMSATSARNIRRSLLLIEDNTDMAQALSQAFTNAGFMVTMAADGEAGLLLLHKRLPSILVLDIRLPRLSGIGVLNGLSEIVKKPGNKTIPVIILTNDSSSVLPIAASLKGYSTFYHKLNITLEAIVAKALRLTEYPE